MTWKQLEESLILLRLQTLVVPIVYILQASCSQLFSNALEIADFDMFGAWTRTVTEAVNATGDGCRSMVLTIDGVFVSWRLGEANAVLCNCLAQNAQFVENQRY